MFSNSKLHHFLLCLIITTSPSFALDALGDDFFGGTTSNSSSSGIPVLDPDFFNPNTGQLQKTPPGKFGCRAVSGQNAQSEANRIGLVAQKYCASRPQITWVPDLRDNASPELNGYYQVCCTTRPARKRRHYRVGE